jgi:hypothetical protein
MDTLFKESSKRQYDVLSGIRVYNGTTDHLHDLYVDRVTHSKNMNKIIKKSLFSKLEPSTLTAQGILTNIKCTEKTFIESIPDPTGDIIMIVCNFGEKFNKTYIAPKKKSTSGRGPKPKPKPVSKRKPQGTGKHLNSQITFGIKNPANDKIYKIKMFRTGTLQIPGVLKPSMIDIIKPVQILRDFINKHLKFGVEIKEFKSVMRNYKTRLLNPKYHVDLKTLETIILQEKKNESHHKFIKRMLEPYATDRRRRIISQIPIYNPMRIAEISYNPDRCMSLIVKFYRPIPTNPFKKVTIKLLKKGKINFDGFNSELEVREVYYWLHHIYHKYRNQILIDITKIVNETDDDSSSCSNSSIYDSSTESDSSSSDDAHMDIDPKDIILIRNTKKPIRKKMINKKKDMLLNILQKPKKRKK